MKGIYKKFKGGTMLQIKYRILSLYDQKQGKLCFLLSSVQHFTEDSNNSNTSGGDKKIGKEEVNPTLFTE